jgi:hypothetical protein
LLLATKVDHNSLPTDIKASKLIADIFGHCLHSSGHHDFPAHLVLLHRLVRFGDVIDVEHLSDGRFGPTLLDLINKVPKWGRMKSSAPPA